MLQISFSSHVIALSVWQLLIGDYFSSDENSNHSSIADSSPVKQEVNSHGSPGPELNGATQRDNSDTAVPKDEAAMPHADGTDARKEPSEDQSSDSQASGTETGETNWIDSQWKNMYHSGPGVTM